MGLRRRSHALVALSTLALASSALALAAPSPASAVVDPANVVIINEVYGGGGNVGSTTNRDFIELFNVSAADVVLDGWSVQYASANGATWAVTPLTGSIKAGDALLVGEAVGANAAGLPDLPVDVSGAIAMSGTNGKVALVNSITALTCGTGCAALAPVQDFVGYGVVNDSAGAPAPVLSNSTSDSRNAAHSNTANNSVDFTAGVPSPQKAAAPPPPPPPPPPAGVTPIAEIQGTGPASLLVDQTVMTRGVVTGVYPVGGFRGYYIQTPGTGGFTDLTGHTASDGLFVFSDATVAAVTLGQYVQVTGVISEFAGLTEMTVTASDDLTVLEEAFVPPAPISIAWPTTDAARETVESMLFQPVGTYTVTNTFATNQFAEVGLAFGNKPLLQPTDIADAGSQLAIDIANDNAGRAVTLDDGATTNFLTAANQVLTPPYISLTDPVRVEATATFNAPVVVDYRNNIWKLQPTATVTSATPPAQRTTFSNNRTNAPDASSLGAGPVKVASFNVLNYFTTLGAGDATCTSFNDRTGNGVTVNSGCDQRGAWDPDDLARQQIKIVKAINALDADVVGLMEIENSLALGETADEAVSTLVGALNAATGATTWAYVPSSADLPPASQMDVINNAIIYRVADVTLVGAARALGDQSDVGEAFDNAREPIGQAFAPVGGGDPFFVAVNHFKSKGSGTGLDADAGDGQGASNYSRVRQATAFRDWVAAVLPTYTAPAVEDVFLIGDFNSYTQEDPLQVLYAAGFADVNAWRGALSEYSYSFSGLSGSLDHVLVNSSAMGRVTGSDIWNINSPESIALEYSRYNYHGSLFYDETPFRSSDHDPVIVAFTPLGPPSTVDLTFLNINDFHGRIDANTVKFAGTVEQLRAAGGEANTAFLAAGDNISASLFASAVQGDQPTIDVLNALGLQATATGNHEFDKGYDDLINRVIAGGTNAKYKILGANVYDSTGEPALDEYAIIDVGGVKVGVIGAVTEETSALVSPGGIVGLTFGDPVEAVNRVAEQLSDGDPSNGEAELLVAEYHEGAPEGTPDGATLEEEVAVSPVFASIVNETSPLVDAIFTGHTHKAYAWDGPIPGQPGKTRPVVQTGNYGENVGKVVLTVSLASHDVTAYTSALVPRTTVADSTLVAQYPRVAAVKTIVDAALAYAAVVGNQPVGSVTADITTAFSNGAYTNGVYTGGTRDDRSKESTLGDLVADALLDSLADPSRGGATIGVVNPGGLRGDLFYAPDGVVTYAEANSILPFVNNLWTVTLTGTQFKTMLEQQWQRDAAGNVPTRAYLQLGLSKNVTYTFDATLPEGSRITSITVDGQPMDPAGSYRIGTFSFLTTGGDNFRIFTQGTDARDSGLVDRDAWIDYITAHSPLTPDFARQAVSVSPLPTNVLSGGTTTFTVSGLDLTSLGSPANTSLTATVGGVAAGTFPVANGAATVALTVPASVPSGARTLVLTASPSGTTVTIPLTVAPSSVDLTFLNINDFHGRIDANTVKFAGTVEQLRAAGGEANTAFLAAGDNISASLFASAVQGDQPTIDVLNALGLQATATGNHEFDKGYDDLINRVIAGGTNAKYKILGANVYDSTGEPALDEYAIIDVGGVKVGVIGAVTEETSALVSPGGIVGLTFGDPVEAVNRVAEQLSDGDPSNGEAELLVAEYHEGAPEGTPDGATLEEEVAVSPVFASIVNETSPLVDAIFTGHTHKAYAWDGPIPGQPGKTRPVVQTGNYGENVGKVVLTVSLASHDVTAYTSALVPRTTVADSTLVAQYPRVAAVKTIVDAALAYAAVVGNQPVGSVTADITTAFSNGAYTNGVYTGGTRDDRSKESTLGDLVADALLDSLADPSRGGATIGVVNPGGLRGDLFYAPDGVVTYAEANSILPFVNNLWTVTLTGTQFKTMLEQQWQRDAAGNVPTRAYLQLGLSKNVTYTFDATLPEGSRITSITVDGQPMDPAGSYRIGTFSFLTTGGDNFRIFTQGTDARDSGLVDRDAWIDYITAHSPLTPDFARQAVGVSNLPTTASIGSTLNFGVSGLDLTSLGSPLNTSISASIGGVNLGSTPVAGGAATLSLVIPAGVPTGQQSLVLTASPSGTAVTIPLTIADPRVASTTTLSLTKTSQVYGTRSPAVAKATVTLVNGAAPTGSVEFADNGVVVATVPVTNGAASYTLPRTAAVGVHSIVATYTGSPTALPSASTAKTVTVTKASSTSVLLPDRIIQFRGGTPAKLTTYISASTDVPTDGTVTFRRNGTIVATVDVVNGRAAYTLPASTSSGIYIFTATYSGSSTVNGSTSNLIPIIVLGR